jgi:uncharacterized membrane protein
MTLLPPLSTSTPDRPAKLHIPELDVLRGLAAVLMVTNHLAGNLLTSEQLNQAWFGTIFFISSFAPVLFFFVTGVGSGIQSHAKAKSARWLSVLNKAVILLVADLLMQWSGGNLLGLDFLGFIGISMLVLEAVRLQKRPLVVCVAGILGLTGLRYAIAPLLSKLFGYQSSIALLNWVLGYKPVANVSYPLSPWMVYPLLGFIVGTLASRHWSQIQQRRWPVILGLAGAGCGISAIGLFLTLRGSGFFRWGTVNFNFYLVSYAAIFAGLALALLICASAHKPWWQSAIALPGVASLAVVPIHYLLIGWVAQSGWRQPTLLSFSLLLLILLTITFLLARVVQRLGARLTQSKQPQIWYGLVAATALLAVITLVFAQEKPLVSLLSRSNGQILLCLLLSMPVPWQRPA